MRICEDPDILNILYIFKTLLNLVTIISIVILIIMIILDIIKMISAGEVDTKKGGKSIAKRVIATFIIFLIPSLVSLVLNFTGQTLNYGSCMDNANREFISVANANKAEEYLRLAENNLTLDALYKAQKYIDKIADGNFKKQLEARLAVVRQYIEDRIEEKKEPDYVAPDPSSPTYDGYGATGNCAPNSAITVLENEPSPDCAINYWSKYVDASKFIYPTSNGKKLGAWPSNHASIPTQISVSKTYQNGKLIWPVTPENGKYHFVYSHNGIDIMAPIGTPIYSPVNGTLMYSEWGHTKNKGSDETAYTVSIAMNSPLTYNGKQYDKIFLTHMSGIINRCSNTSECNKKVRQGELIGFVGNAAGSASSGGYAPHLHMSIYPGSTYSAGIITSGIQTLYGLNCGSGCKDISIKAGG